MIIPSDNWETLTGEHLKHLNEATLQVHHAAQYVAMVGKMLAENHPDDSHTNMSWDESKRIFLGHEFLHEKKYRLGVMPGNLTLILVDEKENILNHFALEGKRIEDGERWVERVLTNHGFNLNHFKLDLHYEIPNGPINTSEAFKIDKIESFSHFSDVRTIGMEALEAFASKYEHASSIRTWPHHFDIGSYIPLQFDENRKVIKSISIGLAIADEYVDEYYFYVTHWSEQGGIDYSDLSQLPSDGYWNKKDWTGAVLPLSNLLRENSREGQVELIIAFLRQAINDSEELLFD